VLTVMPLQYSKGQYLYSATYNSNPVFDMKIGSLDDLELLLASYGVYEDIQIWREGKAEKGLKKAPKETTS
jgi:hypothetical protein